MVMKNHHHLSIGYLIILVNHYHYHYYHLHVIILLLLSSSLSLDVSNILDQLIPDKDESILMVGCGNAPFSPDIMYKGGHKNIINIDISDIVIEQQKSLFPEQQWLVMDVLNLDFEPNKFMIVIDKSLIDTLLCYSDSGKCCSKMIDEIWRCMAPGSRYITFSLHSLEEATVHFTKEKFNWKVSSFLVKSSRWNENEDRHRAVCYTMVVCDKPKDDGSYYLNQQYPMIIDGVLSDDDFAALQAYAVEVNKKASIQNASTKTLMKSLHKVLLEICENDDFKNTSKEKLPNETNENVSM